MNTVTPPSAESPPPAAASNPSRNWSVASSSSKGAAAEKCADDSATVGSTSSSAQTIPTSNVSEKKMSKPPPPPTFASVEEYLRFVASFSIARVELQRDATTLQGLRDFVPSARSLSDDAVWDQVVAAQAPAPPAPEQQAQDNQGPVAQARLPSPGRQAQDNQGPVAPFRPAGAAAAGGDGWDRGENASTSTLSTKSLERGGHPRVVLEDVQHVTLDGLLRDEEVLTLAGQFGGPGSYTTENSERAAANILRRLDPAVPDLSVRAPEEEKEPVPLPLPDTEVVQEDWTGKPGAKKAKKSEN